VIVRYLLLRADLKNLLEVSIVDTSGDGPLVDIIPEACRAETFPGDSGGIGKLMLSSDFGVAESNHRVVLLVCFLLEARVVVTVPPHWFLFLPEAEFIRHILLKYLWLG
jgi:hypothetical protein